MTDKSIGKLREMAKRGRNYREDFESEMFGESVTYELRPLVDEEFLPLSAQMADILGIDEEEIKGGDTVDEALDEIDSARTDEEGNELPAESVDVSKLDEEFVGIVQEAGWRALTAEYDDEGNRIELTDEEAQEAIEDFVGGYSLLVGYNALDLAGNIQDATKFRGSRGSV